MTERRKQLGAALDSYMQVARPSAAEIAVRTTVASIPYAGGSLLALWDGVAQRRIQERLNIIFDEMKSCLEIIDTEKIDPNFFDSEEFQTLFYLLAERLHTTHDQEKLRMFGRALANGCQIKSQSDDKEFFIRTLRELSLSDIQFVSLQDLANWKRYDRPYDDEHNEEMSRYSRLLGLGLITERSIPGLDGAITRLFKRSNFANRFLGFIASHSKNT